MGAKTDENRCSVCVYCKRGFRLDTVCARSADRYARRCRALVIAAKRALDKYQNAWVLVCDDTEDQARAAHEWEVARELLKEEAEREE